MKALQFHYSMRIRFASPVREHHFTLRCLPGSDERQRIQNLSYTVFPNEFVSLAQDSFENECIYGYSKGEHDRFEVDVRGNVTTGLSDSISAPREERAAIFKYQTWLTKPGEHLLAYRKKFDIPAAVSSYDKAYRIMEQLHGDFTYEAGATNVLTTAEEALALRKGVCQDYAHIMISLCRMFLIPARYVVGMLEGEGASHAWVEIYDSGRWYAFDPTNFLTVKNDHIKISNGRDYKDCMINQGVFCGQTTQTQEVSVVVLS